MLMHSSSHLIHCFSSTKRWFAFVFSKMFSGFWLFFPLSQPSSSLWYWHFLPEAIFLFLLLCSFTTTCSLCHLTGSPFSSAFSLFLTYLWLPYPNIDKMLSKNLADVQCILTHYSPGRHLHSWNPFFLPSSYLGWIWEIFSEELHPPHLFLWCLVMNPNKRGHTYVPFLFISAYTTGPKCICAYMLTESNVQGNIFYPYFPAKYLKTR